MTKMIITLITLTNSQSAPTPAPFQQMIQAPITYQNGVRFWSPTDGWLYGWLESISNGTATIWVKIPSSISANSTYQLYMIQDSILPMDGVYWGEAPQLTSTYAQYDNGANVFNYYENFAGTSIPSGWSTNSYTNAIVNNGLKINTNTAGQWAYFLSSFAFNPQTNVLDFYAYATSASCAQFGWYSPQYFIDCAGYYGLLNFNGSVANKVAISGGSYSSYQVWSIGETDSTGTWATLNYGNMVTNTGGYTAVTSNRIVIDACSNLVYVMVQWLRVRAYPPNGVMPSVSFGAPQYSGELITVTVP